VLYNRTPDDEETEKEKDFAVQLQLYSFYHLQLKIRTFYLQQILICIAFLKFPYIITQKGFIFKYVPAEIFNFEKIIFYVKITKMFEIFYNA